MRLRCRLRELRGNRSLRDVEEATKVNRGDLSRIELGRQVPTDEQMEALEPVYGPMTGWWDWRGPLVVMEMDEPAAEEPTGSSGQ